MIEIKDLCMGNKLKVKTYLSQLDEYKEIVKSIHDEMNIGIVDFWVMRGKMNKILKKITKVEKELKKYDKNKYYDSFCKVFLHLNILIYNYTELELEFSDQKTKKELKKEN